MLAVQIRTAQIHPTDPINPTPNPTSNPDESPDRGPKTSHERGGSEHSDARALDDVKTAAALCERNSGVRSAGVRRLSEAPV